MKKVLIKLTGLLVTSAIALSGNGIVLATETDGTDAETGTAVEETVENNKDDEVQAEAPVEDKKGDETPEKKTEPEDKPVQTEKPAESDKEELVQIKCDCFADYVDKTAYDNNKLAAGYINNVFYKDNRTYSYNFAQELPANKVGAFTYLKGFVSDVAAGKVSYTKTTIPETSFSVSYTAQELGVETITQENLETVKNAALNKLMADISPVLKILLQACPYEMYWCDKTKTGIGYSGASYNSSTFYIAQTVINYRVAKEYRVDESDLYTFDTSWGTSVTESYKNAIAIVNKYSKLNDYKKLEAYRNEICDLVDYNHPAADDDDTPYGNPWQMIWVFDGDDNTKVVCEGYSKAFQFLCDNSTFINSEIYALSVYGNADFVSVSGGHMWNVVHMDDGKNYLVDVTNCDHDDRSVLFLRGKSGNPSSGKGYKISVSSYTYVYTYSDGSLTPDISTTDYKYVPSPDPEPDPEPAQVRLVSLALNAEIGVRFKLELPDEFLDDSDAYAEVNGTRCRIEEKETNSGYYPVTYNVAVPDTDKKLVLKLYKGNGTEYPLYSKTGEDVTEEGFEYSVAKYMEEASAPGSGIPDDTIKIIKRLSDYSKYSKKYFKRTDNLGDYSDISGDVANVSLSDLSKYKPSISTDLDAGIVRDVTSLALESATEINHKFKLSNGKNISDFNFYVNGTLVTTTSTGNYRLWYNNSIDRYVLTIKGITAPHLQDAYTVVIKDKNDSTVLTISNFSALSYAYMVLYKAADSTEYANSKAELIALVKSMYLYNRASVEKFNVTE